MMLPALKPGLIAGLFVAASVATVSAQSMPALVTSDLHHRMGPSQSAPSFGVIRGGTTVEAGPCGGGWCEADIEGNPGFLSQRYLDFGGPPPGGYYAAPPPPPPAYGPPPVIYGPRPAYPPYHQPWDSRRW